MNQLLGKENSTELPDHNCAKDLANAFAITFSKKIKNIRKDLLMSNTVNLSHEESSLLNSQVQLEVFDSELAENLPYQLSSFKEATIEEVSKVITASGNKQCSLDPIPT